MTQQEIDDRKDRETWAAIRLDERGFYYYSVSSSVRRSGQYKVSAAKYKKLVSKYGKAPLVQS